MLARVRSAAVLGVDAYPVDVEVDLSNGLPSLATVGLPQSAVKEGRERVHAAILNAGFQFPLKRITVNLAPADRPKAGSGFDLAIALGILVASGQVPRDRLADSLVLAEIGLEETSVRYGGPWRWRSARGMQESADYFFLRQTLRKQR